MPPVLQADTSPYATLGQPQAPPNLLGPLAQVVGIQNAQNQNALFQQTFKARQALGPIAQQSVDPNTGQMDYNKFALGISTNPETAFMAPEILNQLAQKQLVQSQNVKEQLSIALERRKAINDAIAPLVDMGSGVKNTDIMKTLTSPDIAMLGVDPKDAVAIVSSAPKGGQELQQWVLHHAQQGAGAEQALTHVLGHWQEGTNPDGSKFGGFASPISGFTPSTMAGAGGQPGAQPQQQPGQASPFPPAGNGPGAPGMGGASSPAPQGAGAPPQTNAPGQPVQTGLSPYRQQALDKTATYENDLNERKSNANQLVALMGQAQKYLKDFTPGGGEEFRAEMAQLAQSMGMPKETLDAIASGDLGSVQAARKMFFGIGSQMAGNLIRAGGGRMTQSEWAQTLLKGSPNIDLDPRAISNIMGSMRELAHYTKMEGDYFNMKKSSPGYDMTRAQNDWSNVLGEIIARKNGGQ